MSAPNELTALNPWASGFRALYDKAARRYGHGADTPETLVPDAAERNFLASNGLRLINLFDYIEDAAKYGEPDFETALLIASARREFFLLKQKGEWANHVVGLDDLPPKSGEVEGIVWLPRVLQKARAFLTGELARDVMYGCGGDRKFFVENRVNPVDFLRVVEAAAEDDQAVIDHVKACRQTAR